MAIKLIDRDFQIELNDYKCDYICDTEADVATLPTACTGSSALVVESGAVYVVNASGVWAVLGG